MNTNTQNQILAHIEKGDFATLGEYRMSKAEMLSWRDKQTGQARSAPVLRHTVEVGDKSITVNERVPDNTKLEDIRIPHHKGDPVVLVITELAIDRGIVSCRGTLEQTNGAPSPVQRQTVGGDKTR